MSEYTTTITGFFEEAADPAAYPSLEFSSACIVVRPPIRVGEKFKDAILGAPKQDSDRGSVSVSEVITTNEATSLMAMSGRGDIELRHADIKLVAERIGQLANTPETAVQMMADNPFPKTDAEYGL